MTESVDSPNASRANAPAFAASTDSSSRTPGESMRAAGWRSRLRPWMGQSVWRRQLTVCGVFALILAGVVASLYVQSRRREWTLREEQASHRLDMASGLLERELERVRSDVLYLADQLAVREFVAGDNSRRADVESEFKSFVQRKAMYDQIRLLSMNGEETVRVNYQAGQARVIAREDLQDKEDRYYYRESLDLARGELFVSEFDLNLEYGMIERPLKPVIRFVTPVHGDQDSQRALLVLNYLGAPLLAELDERSLAGMTLLIRKDGQYLRGPLANDGWGWLLGHDRTFTHQFPSLLGRLIDHQGECLLTAQGAFACRQVALGRLPMTRVFSGASAGSNHPDSVDELNESILVVSYLPRDQVFAGSALLLRRLLIVAGCVMLPLIVLARHWAQSSISRESQATRIAESEARLRDLSSRLLRLQEDERRAISREIHDQFGQQVTAINLDLKLAARNLEGGNAEAHLERAIAENEQLLQSLHDFASKVRPAVLDDLGLLEAVQTQVWDFEKRTGIPVATLFDFHTADIPPEVADNVYRLVQESLNNIAKHAEATRVEMELKSIDADANINAAAMLSLVVSDDGRGGIEDNRVGERLGLVGMRERVDLLRGTLSIDSAQGQGTTVRVVLPLNKLLREAGSSEDRHDLFDQQRYQDSNDMTLGGSR